MSCFSEIDILINVHQHVETTRVAAQMWRECGVYRPIFIQSTYHNDTERLRTRVSPFGPCEVHRSSMVDNRYRRGNHKTVIDGLNWYIGLSDRLNYLIVTYSDHWILDYSRLEPHLRTMINYNYDGFTYRTFVKGPCYNTSFLVMKTDLYRRFLAKRSYWFGMNGQSVWEQHFYNEFKDCNWYVPSGDTLYSQYGYHAFCGMAHVHFSDQKLQCMKLWEGKHNKVLDVDYDVLSTEYINPNSENWPNRCPADLDDDTARHDGLAPWG